LKVLLVYPYFLEARIHVEEIAAVPMGLYYIGAMLEAHGYSVKIVNWHRRPDSQGALKETLISYQPDIIGFSIVHANRWGGVDIARLAKQIDPQVPVVFGGIGATFLWRHLLTHFADIDYVVLGEGEYTLLHLVEALKHMEPMEKISAIPGLALRVGDDIVRTATAEPVRDLDSLPPPATYFDFQHLSITRGCPGRCSFCGSPQFWGRRVRAHSATYFVDQLILLARRGGRFFYFSDDTFTLNSDLVIEICRKIIEAGLDIRWQAISRVSAVNDRMLRWMRKAGCVQISYGVESGSERIRRLLCKEIGTKQIERAFALTTANGILARAYFIYGAPTESWKTIEQSLELIRRIRPLSAIFYIMALFPGTALYDDFKKRTGIDDDIWLQRIEDILYFEHDPEMDQALIRDFGRRLRRTYHQLLPEFAQRIELKKDPDIAKYQAGFLSRLGMTFSHGDYAAIDTAIDTSQVALELCKRALSLYPDHRAYWAMAMVYQRQNQWDRAIDILNIGLANFPKSEELAIGMGVSLMRAAQYRQALAYLMPHAHSKQVAPYIERCRRELDRMNTRH
jgi:radical SAM superfamily enzyme YgiQ (UPF0313 family)